MNIKSKAFTESHNLINRETALQLHKVEQINALLRGRIFNNIEERVTRNTLGENIKKPLDKRLSESKFAHLIKTIPTDELMVLTSILGFSNKGIEAIGAYLNAENHSIQVYALKKELEARTYGFRKL